MWSGYLVVDGTEIINVSRTEAYASLERAPWFRPAYRNEALRPLLGQDAYVSPGLDLAPWYDEDVTESNDFWGVYPLSMEGGDSSSRESASVEFTTAGGSPGRLRMGTKNAVYSCVLVGATDRAVEYGMRWLRRATLGAVCSSRLADETTLGSVAEFLSVAPVLPVTIPGGDPVDGDTVFLDGGDASGIPPDTEATIEVSLREYVRRFRNAKVVDGPTVTRKRSMSGPCGGAAWLVTFTLQAGDPYQYGYEQTVLQGYMDPEVTDPWSPDLPVDGVADTAWAPYVEVECGQPIWTPVYDPLCGAMTVPPGPPSVPLGCYTPPTSWNRRKVTIPAEIIPLWGDMMPQLTVFSETGLRNLRVRWYADPDGDFDPDDSPCDFVGDWVLSYIAPGWTLIVDAVARQSRVITDLGRVRSANSLVFQNDSTPIVWPSLTCGYGYVMTLDLPDDQPTPVVDLALVPRAAA